MGEEYHQASLCLEPQTKCCTQCHQTLSVNDFYRRKAECKTCSIQRALAYQKANPEKAKAWAATHREERNAAGRQRYSKKRDDPAHRESNRKTSMEWRAKNRQRHRDYAKRYAAERPEQTREYQQRHYQEHKDERRADSQAWRKANRERHRLLSRIDGRKRYLGRDTETFAYAEVLRGDPCSYCGAPPPSAVDHIVPLSRGGPNSPDNLTASCIPCNSRKRSKPLVVFLREIGK